MIEFFSKGDFIMKQQKFKKLITTKRLKLKPIEPSFEFAKLLYNEISNNRDFFKFMPFASVTKPEEEYNFLISGKQNADAGKAIAYAMFNKTTNQFIGMVSVHNISWKRESGEFGAWVCKKFAHQGFTTEGIKALEAYFFQMGFHKLSAKANIKNKASCGTLKKLGLKKEGIEREATFNKQMQEWENFVVFSKLVSEYK